MSENNKTSYNPKGSKWPLLFKLRLLAWNVTSITLFRCSPFFCYGWRRFLLRLFGAKVSSTATIGRTAVIEVPWNLSIGENSMIGKNSWIMCTGGVKIGDNVAISEYVRILAGSHKSNSINYEPIVAPIVIENDCWIASCAMLVAGGARPLKIGKGAIVGAGAVVFSNVRSMTIVVGNPAEYLTDRVLKET